MKLTALVFFLILGILGILYLNYSYSNFYNYQGNHFLKNPPYSKFQEVKSNKGNEMKLVILGDSLMAGTGTFDEKKSLAYLIAEGYAEKEDVTLINLAIPGVGVKHVYEVQVPETLEQKPDQIFLMIGTNDVHNRVTDRTFRNYLRASLDKLLQTKAKVTVINIPYIGSNLILYSPWDRVLDGRIREFNQIIESEAASKGLGVIDLYTPFKEQFKNHSDLYSLDEFHPSEKGYKLWADYIKLKL